MLLNIEEIVKATGGKIISEGSALEIEKIDTDSRVVGEKSLFVPIKGEKFDAHDFILDVIKKGCKAVVSERELVYDDVTVVLVKDTKIALGDIARYYIDKVSPKKIAITGSVGKTTTKDFVASVCESIDKTLKTKGNFNNDIGVPLTAFNLNEEKIAVFEIGMNHFGEIEYLTRIVKPHIGIITNIGHSHIENLGSQEGILKAKLEILEGMDSSSTLILNGDDPLLFGARDSIKCNVIYYGINNESCHIKAYDIKEADGVTTFKLEGYEYKINVMGIHNVYNSLCAIAAGKLLGGDYLKIKEGLNNFKPEGIRQNIVKKDDFTVIVDCYNAAPDSMIASLDVMSKTKGARKIAVFGSVAELGSVRDTLLYKVGSRVKDFNVDELITVSEDALAINKGARESGFINEKNFKSNQEVLEYLKSNIKKDDVVLIKGSRKYKMEEISEGLIK